MSTETRTTDDGRILTERGALNATRKDGGVVVLAVYATEDVGDATAFVTAAKVGSGDGLLTAAYQADPVGLAELLGAQGLAFAGDDDEDEATDRG